MTHSLFKHFSTIEKAALPDPVTLTTQAQVDVAKGRVKLIICPYPKQAQSASSLQLVAGT